MDLLSAAFRKETTTADGRTQRYLLAPPQDTARGLWLALDHQSKPDTQLRRRGPDDRRAQVPRRAAPGLVLSCLTEGNVLGRPPLYFG
ncbi:MULTISPECIES: hypothetical protein [Streptomyces]|uniref:Uncharacterized protein n=1 Tax=Streptomyces griseus subsp. griseus (strain JCM 4626 / CBS 651.72 / NBRC 13350 / KCC S-0626 / ISP 5235) TaxID=455632 RepID=B1VPR6_STRGG|nr:hypothetical protein [Streptomyces griseus]BAG23816.1 hypothetical protein SGR_6989 [Streptomyces griseus subsp. griseus NBRC 13350]